MSTDEAARLAIDRSVESGAVVLVLTGELDPHTAPLLEDAARGAAQDGEVILDLAGVSFLDSAGVRAILEINRGLGDSGQELVLRSPSSVASRVLEIAGLDQHLRIE